MQAVVPVLYNILCRSVYVEVQISCHTTVQHSSLEFTCLMSMLAPLAAEAFGCYADITTITLDCKI
jgi:hypothetical protein